MSHTLKINFILQAKVKLHVRIFTQCAMEAFHSKHLNTRTKVVVDWINTLG